MKYWDSSALVEAILNPALRRRLISEGGYTRSHTLSEAFSALTGNLHIRSSANEAAQALRVLAGRFRFVQLTEQETLDALDKAQSPGVRGGRVHDYLHALAAEKSKAEALLTMDRNDFHGLIPSLIIEQV